MEMSAESPRRPVAARPVRGPHGGWQKQEIEMLQRGIDEAASAGESLRSAFERVAAQLGRKPNSIRNFYYAQLRENGENTAQRPLPFETFSPVEVEQLIENVLTARARGMSVRACVRSLAGGDHTRMLRLQNKYRSTVRTRPELVQRVMQRLSEEGVPYVSPYALTQQEAQPQLSMLRQRAAQTGDARLESLFDSLDHLLTLALSPKEEEPGIGTGEAQRRADRLGAHCDMLRIALSDEQRRLTRLREETGGMVTLIKEFIALPQSERSSCCAAFCQQAAGRLSAVECAMMEPDDALPLPQDR